MSRMPMDTRVQNAWKELVEKEANTRVECKLRQEANKDEDEWFVRSKYTQAKAGTLNIPTAIKFPPKPAKKDPSLEIERLSQQLKESGVNLLSDMKKPDEATSKLLYDGLSKEGKGRRQYLEKRKLEKPEERYEYPINSSFEYGWKLKEVAQEYKTPIHGRGRIVEESFYRRNGVF
jgi:hypothetical protein